MFAVYGGEKMEITALKIGGFKNIESCELNIDKIIGLLAVNSYGKSNILEAIQFGFDFITEPVKVKDQMLGWKKGMPYNVNISSPEFNFDITLTYSKDEKNYEIRYGYSFSWRINEEYDARINEEHLIIKELSNKQKPSYYIKRENGDYGKYKASKTGRCDKKIRINHDGLIINKLQAFDELFYATIIKEINHFEIYIDRHLDSSGAFEIDPIIRKNNDDLKLATSDNIPRILNTLKEKYRDKYAYLMDIYMRLFPKIEEMTIKKFKLTGNVTTRKLPDEYEIAEYAYILYCKERNMSSAINFEGMSDGTKRILLVLTNLILAEINHVLLFCVEEPENSINPSLFQKYIEVINDLIGQTKIILTSHSPYLIDYLDPEKIYIGCNNSNDLAEFKAIKRTAVHKLYDDAARLGMDYAEYLFDLFANSNEEINKYVQ